MIALVLFGEIMTDVEAHPEEVGQILLKVNHPLKRCKNNVRKAKGKGRSSFFKTQH